MKIFTTYWNESLENLQKSSSHAHKILDRHSLTIILLNSDLMSQTELKPGFCSAIIPHWEAMKSNRKQRLPVCFYSKQMITKINPRFTDWAKRLHSRSRLVKDHLACARIRPATPARACSFVHLYSNKPRYKRGKSKIWNLNENLNPNLWL